MNKLLKINNKGWQEGGSTGGYPITLLQPDEWVRVFYENGVLDWGLFDSPDKIKIENVLIGDRQVIYRGTLDTLLGEEFMRECDNELVELLQSQKSDKEAIDNSN